jgi:MFS family permease
MVGAIASLLDTTVVNVGLDAIARDLNTTVATAQWVMTGYLLSFAMVIPLNGWGIARFGAKTTWMTSLTVFLAGSVACGAAWNVGSLVAFQVVQGLGGGMLLPVLTTLLIQAARGRSLGRLMSTVSRPAAPVLDLRLFRVRSFTGSACLMFVAGLSMYGALLLLPLYYQQVRGASPLTAGLLLVPQGVGSLIPRTMAGRLTDRTGPKPVILTGMALAALGTVPFALAGPHTSLVWLSAALVVRGAGLAAATIAVMATAFTGLAPAQVPHASSATRILQQVGGSFGTAVLIVILELQLTGPGAATTTAVAFDRTFWWAIAFTVVGALPALLLSRPSMSRPDADRPRSARPE